MGDRHDPAADIVLGPRQWLASGLAGLNDQNIAVRQSVDRPRVGEVGRVGGDRQAISNLRSLALPPAHDLGNLDAGKERLLWFRQDRVGTDLLRYVEIVVVVACGEGEEAGGKADREGQS